jgi:hypothetical protein
MADTDGSDSAQQFTQESTQKQITRPPPRHDARV